MIASRATEDHTRRQELQDDGEKTVENYIVRIYRYQKDNPRRLVGTVESIENKGRGKRAFTNLDDLWEILNSQILEEDLPKQGEAKKGRDDGIKTPFEE